MMNMKMLSDILLKVMADDKLKPVGDADIKMLLKIAGLEGYEALMNVLSAWDDVAGPHISAHTELLEVTEDGVLVVAVDDSTWFTELRMLSGELLKKINERLKSGKLRKIKFKLRTGGKR